MLIFLIMTLTTIEGTEKIDFFKLLEDYHNTILCISNIAEESIPGIYFRVKN
jgi:hypothetical protein